MGMTRALRPRPAGTAIVVAVLCSCLTGCAPAPQNDPGAAASGGAAVAPGEVGLDNLNAVLWLQTAVEYRATSLQAYALGRRLLDEALADPRWTAALEQTGDFADLPPAVVLDIDETVLDNSYLEARLTIDGAAYSDELWDAWVLQAAAAPIHGAHDFLTYAVEKEVTVFYISNRRAHLEEATRANLAAEGFPLREDVDTVLLRGEIPEWDTSDKTPRREKVAAGYRILLIFGDNMGDFTAASAGTVAERAAFAEAHRDYWGSRWIALANPSYGSFIGAVLDNDYGMPFAQQVEIKKQALDPRR